MTVLRIKELCKEKGISQKQLAALLDLREDSFSIAIKRNSLSLAKLDKIADALGVPVADLLAQDPERGASIICPHCGQSIKLKVD